MQYFDTVFLSVVPLFIVTLIVLGHYLLQDYEF